MSHYQFSPAKPGQPTVWLVVWTLVCLASGSVSIAEQPFAPQTLNPLTENWRWREYPQLKGRGLKSLEQDHDGNMWFGVNDGAVRYDGKRWSEFGHDQGLTGTVVDFCRTERYLYACTPDNIFMWVDGKWRELYSLPNQVNWIIESLSSGSNGTVWAATNWGAIEFDMSNIGEGHSATLYSTQELIDASDRLFGNHQFETKVVDSPEVQSWPSGAGAYVYGPIPNGQNIIALAPEGPAAAAGLRVGDQLVSVDDSARPTLYQRDLECEPGTKLKLKFKRPGEDGIHEATLTCAEVEGRCATFRPFSIVVDQAGTVWFGTRLGKIISLARNRDDSETWTHHTEEHQLTSVAVPSLTVTPQGIAAVGRSTNTRDLLQFDGQDWTSTSLPRALSSSIIATNSGRLLIGTSGGIISIGDDTRLHLTSRYGIYRNQILLTQTMDNAIWVAGVGGSVLRIEPQGGKYTTYRGLNFQQASPNGEHWFLSRNLTVVRQSGNKWTEYDSTDGLMTIPQVVLATRSGEVWAAGSHEGVAATARLRGGQWELQKHPRLHWSIGRRATYEDRDGRLWFGAGSSVPPDTDFLGGVVRFDGHAWKHFVPTVGMTFVYGITQTRDGTMWFAGPSLAHILPDDSMGLVTDLPIQARAHCDALATDREGNLLIGSRFYGLGRLDGDWATTDADRRREPVWENELQGLSNNSMKALLPMADGNLLACTFSGINCFDGQVWGDSMFPDSMAEKVDYGGMRRTGYELWTNINSLSSISYKFATTQPVPKLKSSSLFRTLRYIPAQGAEPETSLQVANAKMPAGEPIPLAWTGLDPWNDTQSDKLSFSWRVNDGQWSPYTRSSSIQLPNLKAGKHDFEVRARDLDMNVDPTPAFARFEIIAPLWRRGWFQLLMLALTGLMAIVAAQSARVMRQDMTLRTSNRKLHEVEQQLRQANVELEKRVVERTKELEQSNLRLRQSQLRYRSIVQDQTEYILRFDSDWKLEFANDAYLRCKSVANQSTTDSSKGPTIPVEERQRVEKIIQRLTNENLESDIVAVDRPDGSVFWEEWQGRMIQNDKDKSIAGYQAVGRNITDLKQARERLQEKEQQLAHLARVSALGEMVAGISHEIKQPLASIANFSTATKLILNKQPNRDEDSANLRDWINHISKQTERIDQIIKSLRRFGRPGSDRTLFPVCHAIKEALLVTEGHTRNRVGNIDIDCPEDLPPVFADQVQIEQVLVNLVQNACEAMIKLPVDQRLIRIEAREFENSVKVCVQDSGPGMELNLDTDVFHTFVTTKAEGIGMGLAISRSIIEAHGGKIEAVKGQPFGRIEFTLPLQANSLVDVK